MSRAAQVREALPEINQIGDPALAELVTDIWVECWEQSRWERLEDMPTNPKRLPNSPLVQHVRGVTLQSLVTGRVAQELHGIPINFDLLLAGALLHDVSKLIEYEPSEGTPGVQSELGALLAHGFAGASAVHRRGGPLELVHLILTHSGNQPNLPISPEGVILRSTDHADYALLQMKEAAAAAG